MPSILLATDADWLYETIDSTITDEHTSVLRVSGGNKVIAALASEDPDLVILDMQTGTMGAFATCHAMRLEESADRLPHYPVLMLLDRDDDRFLAERSTAEGWLIKPLDGLRLARAVKALLAGDEWKEERRIPV